MILFFYGEETYKSLHDIKQLKNKFLQKNPTGGGLMEFDCDEECDIFDIRQSFGEQNLFAQKKFIIIKNIFANTKAPEQKEIITALEREIEDVIVFIEVGKVKKNAALFKWLKKNAQTIKENNLLEGNKLERWIESRVKKNGKNIDRAAVAELILFVGNNLWKLSKEIEKLICFTDKNNIVVQDVRSIVNGRVDANMFEMIEAIALNNKKEALKLLNKQIVAGDELFHIFSMYAYQVRVLLKVGGVMNDGVSDKNTIAKIIKLHPFVVQKSMGMIRNLSYPTIKKMHKELAQIDFDVKQGNCDIQTAMNLFVVKI